MQSSSNFNNTIEAARLRLSTAHEMYFKSTFVLQNAQDQVNAATKELNDAMNHLKSMEQQQRQQQHIFPIHIPKSLVAVQQ